MSTFSQIVDELATEHLRPDLLVTICEYLNQTIRELHMAKGTGNAILFDSNRVEAQFVPSSLPAQWPIPVTTRFQRLETVFYVERGVYARKLNPTRVYENGHNNFDPYWYRSGQYIILNGLNQGETAKISYFEFPRRLAYYPTSQRPASFNFESEAFTYLTSYDTDDNTRLTAQGLVTNWMLLRWPTVLKEGVRAKVFKRLGEKDRAIMAFSAFEAQREGLNSAESYESNE